MQTTAVLVNDKAHNGTDWTDSREQLCTIVTDPFDGTTTSKIGTRTYYDEFGRVVRTERVKSISISETPYAWDAGTITTIYLSAANTTDNSSSLTAYNAEGNVCARKDPAGTVATYQYTGGALTKECVIGRIKSGHWWALQNRPV